jgi:predicted O-linked N-acetylglucosamine transferase (SPINDLY family)
VEGKRGSPGSSRRPLSEPARQALLSGFALHQAGRLLEAQELYKSVLSEQPDNFDAAHLIGVLASQMQKPREAQKWLAKAIAISPGNPAAHNHLGNALKELNRLNDALASYDRAIALDRGFVQARINRGRCLQALERPEKALASYEAAIAVKPDLADAHDGRGSALMDLGRPEEAITSFDRAIALRPDYAEAHNNRGVALKALKRSGEALAAYDRAVKSKPDFALAHDNRGAALAALDRHDEALASHERAIALNPSLASAHYNSGKVLEALKRWDEAILAYNKAIALKPDFAEAYNNRGAALAELQRWNDAVASYDKAIVLNPKAAPPHHNRGNALKALKRYDEANGAYKRALALDPNDVEAHCGRGDVLAALARHVEAAEAYARALEIDPNHPFTKGLLLHQNLLSCDWRGAPELIAEIETEIAQGRRSAEPFGWQGVSTSPRSLRSCARIFNAARIPSSGAPRHTPTRSPAKKIRIGYVSGELRAQATSYLLVGVLEHHDKSRFEVLAYDNGWDDKSETRARIGAAVTEIVDISRLDDRAAAAAIRHRNIDILINLNGYFGLHRTGVFALRPAPIQVNYLGFPGTLGADYLDYLVADRVVIPEDHLPFYDESVVYLPGCYQANDDRKGIDAAPVSRSGQGLPEEAVVFCCFNNPYKILPETFDSWMRILKRVPTGVLWLFAGNDAAVGNLRKEANNRDVDPGRLIFAERRPLAKHLARLGLADLFLDTLPYNAHTTASDALWAGVPVLTQIGQTFPGRVAASLLTSIGLPELVTSSREAFEALAVELATNPDRLSALREKLGRQRLTAPLFDTELYTRRLEAAFAAMHARQQAGLPPDHIHVEP